MNTLNSKTDESNRFMYQLTDKFNHKHPNENMSLANLSIYYTWNNIKSEYDNNKFKINDLTWNDKFDSKMDRILFLIFKIILNISSKNMKLLLIILLYKFM